MKTIKFLLLILCAGFLTTIQAQKKDKNILKVSYVSGSVSNFLVGMLKKQVKDQKQFSKILHMMEEYKVYNSYYQNLKTKESVFILDSIHKVKGLNTSGYTYYTYRNKDGEIQGKEILWVKTYISSGTLKI